jgi:hypothetical protein
MRSSDKLGETGAASQKPALMPRTGLGSGVGQLPARSEGLMLRWT